MNPDLISKAVEQVPGLTVLAFIVWMFLKHLKGYSTMIRDMHRENISDRERSREIIEQNTIAVSHNTRLIDEMRKERAL